MKVIIDCNSGFSEFSGARQFLLRIGYKPKTIGQVNALRPIFPFDRVIEEKRRQSSLTHNMGYEEQIRFIVKESIINSFLSIGLGIAEEHRLIEVSLLNANNLDEPSFLFFKILSRFPNIIITVELQDLENVETEKISIEEEEKEILALMGSDSITEEERDILVAYASKYICSGNPWTAERILEHLLALGHVSGQIYTLIGRAYILLEKSYNAEYYCKQAIEYGNANCKVVNYYSMAMLYLRNHPKHLRDSSKASHYLNVAYDIIKSSDNFRDREFHEIFNRNGYALILFRKKAFEEAIDLLQWGISKLIKSSRLRDTMHRSVLMFNLAQCYHAMGLKNEAKQAYHELIKVDPNDSDYRVKLASVYIEMQQYENAKAQLYQAKWLNPANADIYILLEECLSESGSESINEQIMNLEQAHMLDPNNYDLLYNLCSLLMDNNDPEKCLNFLKQINAEKMDPGLLEDIYSLKSEVYLALNDKKKAILVLQEGIRSRPKSKDLLDNLDQVLNLA